LDHKIIDDPVKQKTIVESFLGQPDKIFFMLWGFIEKYKFDISIVCPDRNQIIFITAAGV
jgi:hypothetical protein